MTAIVSWLTALILSTTPPGSGGPFTYTFDGYLPCKDAKILGGCLKNGTHLYVVRNLQEYDCYAMKHTADSYPGGAGAACIKENNK